MCQKRPKTHERCIFLKTSKSCQNMCFLKKQRFLENTKKCKKRQLFQNETHPKKGSEIQRQFAPPPTWGKIRSSHAAGQKQTKRNWWNVAVANQTPVAHTQNDGRLGRLTLTLARSEQKRGNVNGGWGGLVWSEQAWAVDLTGWTNGFRDAPWSAGNWPT